MSDRALNVLILLLLFAIVVIAALVVFGPALFGPHPQMAPDNLWIDAIWG